ncbi:MAG: 4'-phosphopantetheinyl transferase superfamily protein [Jatrophihabitantaceae bacterium]
MIDQILPDWVAVAESRTDGYLDELYPEERELIANAVAKRQEEFATVRSCARRAMRQLDIAPVPVLPGERGAPGWPAGVVGSMTHCAGYRAAVLASDRLAVSIGVDAEPHEPLPAGVIDLVALPAERDQLAELSGSRPRSHWDRLLFSMKESVYKAWFPLTRRWLDFQQAQLQIDPIGQRFQARLLVTGPQVHGAELSVFEGRYLIQDGFVLSAIVIE